MLDPECYSRLGGCRLCRSVAFLAFLAIRRFPTVDKILLCNLRDHVREVFVLCRLLNGTGTERSPFTEAASVADALKDARRVTQGYFCGNRTIKTSRSSVSSCATR